MYCDIWEVIDDPSAPGEGSIDILRLASGLMTLLLRYMSLKWKRYLFTFGGNFHFLLISKDFSVKYKDYIIHNYTSLGGCEEK